MNRNSDTSLRELTFEPLPLGEIRPTGWLERQLRIQADGLTGHLDEFWPDLQDNQWVGGERGGWERGPYYVDGLLPLAHLLDDDELKEKADKWISGFLDHQQSDGWIGPLNPASHQGNPYDPWPCFVVLKVLRQYYEVTGDAAIIEVVCEFCSRLDDELVNNPLESWAKYRWQDLVVIVYWLYEQTSDEGLLDLVDRVIKQGYDWNSHYGKIAEFEYADPAEDWSQDSHVVNHAMSLKAPGLTYRRSKSTVDQKTAYRALQILNRYHGQATGIFSGDECLAGLSPTRGTELCAVVESMYSLEQLVSILGDTLFADRLERIAYNALPATFTPDMWTHQYDQQANQVICNVAPREWTNGPDANTFGLEPNFGCCTANMHQGWPKFAKHLWMRAEDGLAATMYAPSSVETELDGVHVEISEETDYPFADTVRLTVEPSEPLSFSLYLRIPAWTHEAEIMLSDGETHEPTSGGFYEVSREWSPGDTVDIRLTPELEAERRYQGAVALRRGPLVFTYPIEAERKQIGGEQPHPDWEFYPTEPWNYGLHIDTATPAAATSRRKHEIGEYPFSPETPPVTLDVPASLVPEWQLSENNAGPIPNSPTPNSNASESIELVPYGCTTLRVTEFPLLPPH